MPWSHRTHTYIRPEGQEAYFALLECLPTPSGCPLTPPRSQHSTFLLFPYFESFLSPQRRLLHLLAPCDFFSEFSRVGVCAYSSPPCPIFNNWEVSQPRAFYSRKEVHSTVSLHHPCRLKEAPSKSSLGILLSQAYHGGQANTVCWPLSTLLCFLPSHRPYSSAYSRKNGGGERQVLEIEPRASALLLN